MFSALRVVLFVLILCLPLPLTAQTEVEPERVIVNAADDGLVMVGDFYRLPGDHPAVLLLHGQGSDRRQWTPLIPLLTDAGYHVLNVDQRGFGETGGTRDLPTMIRDTEQWLGWLRAQPNVSAIGVIGASMGTVPALGACANVMACATVIMISPGDFPLLDADMYASMSERSVLFMVGRDDNVLYDTLRMFERTTGEAAVYVYPSAVHGSAYFSERSPHRESVTALVLGWLNDHLRVE